MSHQRHHASVGQSLEHIIKMPRLDGFPGDARRTVVLDETLDAALVRLDRIAGALHVTQSRLRLKLAARMITGHLEKFPAVASQYERLVSRLPWAD